MLRAIFQAVFGRREEPDSSPQPQRQESQTWREAPTKTWVDDIGGDLVATVSITTGHHGFVQVVGESHYQDTLRTLAGKLGSEGVFTARLVPEPDNPHDSNAVAVFIEDHSGAKIGYLARQIARSYQPRLLNHRTTVTCPARPSVDTQIPQLIDTSKPAIN
jgi:HIRAN domain